MSPASGPNNKILELNQIIKQFKVRTSAFGRAKTVTVLDGIHFSMERGEILSLVGESGCGKTTVGKIVTGLLKPTSGNVIYNGNDIWSKDKKTFREFRRKVQMIHQDPYTSLNPSQRIYDVLVAPLYRHGIVKNRTDAEAKIRDLMKLVDLSPVEDFIYKYPHQLSGGQRQRASIARTLTVNPDFIVADEAVSMLDISIRLSIIDLMLKLKAEFGVTYLFITHDLAIAKYFGKVGRIAVMYLGRIVEIGPTLEIIKNARHPYTRVLLAALPEADPDKTRKKKEIQLRSLDIPNLLELPTGCKFHPRCPVWLAGKCDQQEPKLEEIGGNHQVACFNPQDKDF